MFFHVKLLDGKLPTRSEPEAVGYDLFSAEEGTIDPLQIKAFRLGFCSSFSVGYEALFASRSGMASRGIVTFAGLIDPSYRGEWKVLLYNTTGLPYKVNVGDKISQVVFRRVEHPTVTVVETLEESLRGTAGFGSTGN